MTTLGELIDLERWPIDALDDDAGRALVDDCRRQLAADGVCSLPEFLRTDAVDTSVRVADDLADLAWHADQTHNVYFTDLDDPATASLDLDHPRRRSIRSSQRAIAFDLLPGDSPVRQLYAADELLRFLERVLGIAPLFRSADPLDGVQVSHFRPDDELGWHFDNSEFSVTLMLREPDHGGHFEWHPSLRTDDDERVADVAAALDDLTPPRRLPTSPGTLAIFQGRHALHRVTPVSGSTTRLNAVFTFGTDPDMRLSPLTQQLFYGRVVTTS